MEQNNMWKNFLIIGLIINLIFIISSCKDYFYNEIGEYQFVNETDYSIIYSVGYEEFNIGPKSKILITQNKKTGGDKGGAKVSDYKSPLYSHNATLNIKFNNLKCLSDVKENDINSVRDIKNFVAEKIGRSHYKFTYTFTDADYNRAVTCQ